MMLILAGVFIVVVWFYILFAREWLDARLQGTAYAYWHEQVEDKLWDKSRTMLTARGYQLAGWVLGLQTLLASAGIDTTPFTNELANLIPEKYRPLAVAGFLIVTGLAFSWLRKRTTMSIGGSDSSLKG